MIEKPYSLIILKRNPIMSTSNYENVVVININSFFLETVEIEFKMEL